MSYARKMNSIRRWRLMVTAIALVAGTALASCAERQIFDSTGYMRSQIVQQTGPEVAARIEVPFAINDDVRAALKKFTRLRAIESERVNQLLDFIFIKLRLSYQVSPTLDAVSTFRTGKGNCLSFVNLFVGMARDVGLNPFYVEVMDYQRWNHHEGLVISEGHIVAGMYLDGKLKTFDFIPNGEKTYRRFRPISDLTAVAHFYNNLGAEALIAGNLGEARRLVTLSTQLAPKFPNGLNNLGVCLLRGGDREGALQQYDLALAADPGNSMVMTNVLRVYQQQGRLKEAADLEVKVEQANTSNPFFFVYLGETALARGDNAKALSYMVRALRLQTDLPEVQLGLVKVYMAQGDLDRARHFLARARELDPTNQEAQRYARLLGAK
jgi:Flp pilus assembly protein TadD